MSSTAEFQEGVAKEFLTRAVDYVRAADKQRDEMSRLDLMTEAYTCLLNISWISHQGVAYRYDERWGIPVMKEMFEKALPDYYKQQAHQRSLIRMCQRMDVK